MFGLQVLEERAKTQIREEQGHVWKDTQNTRRSQIETQNIRKIRRHLRQQCETNPALEIAPETKRETLMTAETDDSKNTSLIMNVRWPRN